jgi:tetratricopeptide (TPR) repeat protein
MALYQIGETQKAEEWFKTFSSVNEQRKKDNAIELRVEAHYLAGIFAAFQGNNESAQKNLQQSLEIDPSYLFARQALVWLDAGLLKGLK